MGGQVQDVEHIGDTYSQVIGLGFRKFLGDVGGIQINRRGDSYVALMELN